MKSRNFIAMVLVASILGFGFLSKERKEAPSDNYVADVLFSLGEPKPDHYIENSSPELIKKGRELIFSGRTTNPKGRKSKYISKFFKCTSCHNTVKEEAILTQADPESRFQYAEENDLPFLQASTFYGIVNRETWYNDDYVKKYGDLVKPARNSLKESIQLCAKECSQGRYIEDWEMEAVLAYFWSIGLKESDAGGPYNIDIYSMPEDFTKEDLVVFIKGNYRKKSPATFGEVPKNKTEGYPGLVGDPVRGLQIYNRSCQHCHREKGESDVVLDFSVPTLNWLKKNITSDSQLSIYEVIRKGTYSEKGHREYMPLYTKEKLSDQQIEDLRAFIELER